MATELRDYGDKKTVVVFTDEMEVVRRLRDRKACSHIVPYEQEQYSKNRVATIGYDFHFPKAQVPKFLRNLRTTISIR